MTAAASDLERFFSKVDRDGPVPTHRPELGPCHVWMGACANGYGRFWFQGKVESASRVSFLFAHGRWPEPQALHHCDNRPCVNDAHLFEGTQAENVADMCAKGRHVSGMAVRPERAARGERNGAHTKPHRTPRGERCGLAKLTEQQVRDIRANYALCRVTQKALSKRYGVSQSVICDIVRGDSWGHLFDRVRTDNGARFYKLDAHKVREIAAAYAAGGVRQRDLADRFCVNQQTISKIVRGMSWRHLGV